VRTGTLRRSINLVVSETETGVFAQVGTNVKYAAIHEYGFDGTEHVGAHVQRSALQMSAKRSKRDRVRDGTVQVKAFDRHMVMPPRSFLRSTLTQMQVEIQTSLRATILQAVRP
jgi:phage gpG-like protein